MKTTVAVMMLAASLSVPIVADADCGDPGQDLCTGPVDNHLHRMVRILPLNFVVTDIQPAPDYLAGAIVPAERVLSVKNRGKSRTQYTFGARHFTRQSERRVVTCREPVFFDRGAVY